MVSPTFPYTLTLPTLINYVSIMNIKIFKNDIFKFHWEFIFGNTEAWGVLKVDLWGIPLIAGEKKLFDLDIVGSGAKLWSRN